MQELPKKTNSLPEEVEEVLEKLPPEARQIVSSMSVSGSIPVFSPVQKKITEEHITKVLEIADNDGERELKLFQSAELTKRLGIGAVILIIAIILVYSGITKETFLSQQIINIVVGAFGGAGLINVFKKKE